jgi:hypothetical protein
VKPQLQESDARVFAEALDVLEAAGVRTMIGGAFALNHYVGLWRDTKDLDIFCERGEGIRALHALGARGFHTRVEEAHWLGKAIKDGRLVDLIWGGGIWATFVDAGWLERAAAGRLLGRQVLFCAPEDIILSKAYVAGRERYDGTDISHLIRACGPGFDWDAMVERFGDHWPLLQVAARIGTADEIADSLTFRGPLVDSYGYFHDLDVEGRPDPREDMARRAGLDIDAVAQRRDLDRAALDSGKVYLPADTSTPPE